MENFFNFEIYNQRKHWKSLQSRQRKMYFLSVEKEMVCERGGEKREEKMREKK